MSKYKILVVDDEIKILNLIKNYLENEGFSVITADGGKKALELFEAEKPDLVVLDIMMPEVSGYDICRKICALSDTPVIMLTAKSEEVDKILGLELGADDYITKPFSLRELAARIRVVLRRLKRQGAQQDSGQDKEDILEYLGLKLDLRKKTAYLDDRPLSLTPTEFKILAMLLGSPGVVFSRLQILEEVLGEYYEGYERSLDTHMSNLRKKLGDDPTNPRYIKTVYGMGYKIGGQS
ncbi:MAG TPA: response regulator transcription factor [Thermoanaerobacterales bacterium]|nr:response regulator transcription factor [Thermoanaerobacterales bacterium]